MMDIPFLDLKAQYQSLQTEIDVAIQSVVDSCAFASGPFVEAFEKEFAAFCGTQHCVCVNSGTAALELLFRAYGIGPGDEVITVANTFFATAEAVSLVGARPVFIDADEKTALMDPLLLPAAITPKTKAIIPVHLYGQPADMDAILAIARPRGLLVIEDSCQAHGARYKGKRTGGLADASAFSFYPGKNLGAYGEGGAVTTNDDTIAKTIGMLRDHGSRTKYEHVMVGRNDRMDGIQGAVLSVKLKHLDAWNEMRRAHASTYRSLLRGENRLQLLQERDDAEHVYHLFVLRVPNRDSVRKALENKGTATGIHYPTPLHLTEAYRSLGYQEGDFPVSEALSKEILSLPMFPELSQEQIHAVTEALQAVL